MCCFNLSLNGLTEVSDLIESGRLFHKSEPEAIKDLANISVVLFKILIFSTFRRLTPHEFFAPAHPKLLDQPLAESTLHNFLVF